MTNKHRIAALSLVFSLSLAVPLADAQPPLQRGFAGRPEPTGAAGALAGKWQRDPDRSNGNYWMGEYPEMTLEIRVEGNLVHVRQALGRVRDGVSLPGSGEEFHAYELTIDGELRDIAAPGAARREGSAQWTDGALHIESTWTLGGLIGDDPAVVTVNEIWTVLDGGETLRIVRTVGMNGREPRRATVVFARGS